GGLAEYLEIDSVLVRLGFVLLFFASGIGLPLYLILWLVMPKDADESVADSIVIQKNINDISETVQSNAKRLGKPATIGAIMILIGAYFLLTEIGIFSQISGAIFWPLLIIGLGVYMLIKRR
ncbi:MAG: PspC domain-containing protein, partial [Candidatus Promineifilaceae bacterium]